MAADAAIEIHPRPESFTHFLRLGEFGQAGVEERELLRRQSWQRCAGGRSAAARTGILRHRRRTL